MRQFSPLISALVIVFIFRKPNCLCWPIKHLKSNAINNLFLLVPVCCFYYVNLAMLALILSLTFRTQKHIKIKFARATCHRASFLFKVTTKWRYFISHPQPSMECFQISLLHHFISRHPFSEHLAFP